LYPTVLRQHDDLWANTVIALSILGVFLTVLGLYLGIARFKRLPSGRRSPYRGIGLWHHYSGLIFGVLILTWVTSGLFSMNPWNLFDLSGGAKEQQRLQGIPMSTGDVLRVIDNLKQNPLPEKTKRIDGYTLNSQMYLLVSNVDGEVTRLNGRTLQPEPIIPNQWQQLETVVTAGEKIASAELLIQPDAYYYSHHGQRSFPVYRIILDNADSTRIYLNSTSGELAGEYDSPKRWYRWLFSGLHQLDVSVFMRSRPVWDLIMWVLLLGVTVGTLTGVWIGAKRVFR
jgi:hypothetical protein